MQIIALIYQKGGVGKIICTINIETGINRLRKRVRLLDLEPQIYFEPTV